jgi:hypothetical protein
LSCRHRGDDVSDQFAFAQREKLGRAAEKPHFVAHAQQHRDDNAAQLSNYLQEEKSRNENN